MTKLGRNAPCPCGSGKKYKRCCLSRQPQVPQTSPLASQSEGTTPDGDVAYFDKIDQLSNSVLDLIEEGKLDQAEEVCRLLSKRYPDQVDGIERMAAVEEARGNYAHAAQYYLKAAAFVKGKPEYDPESEEYYRHMAAEMEAMAGGG